MTFVFFRFLSHLPLFSSYHFCLRIKEFLLFFSGNRGSGDDFVSTCYRNGISTDAKCDTASQLTATSKFVLNTCAVARDWKAHGEGEGKN